MTSIGDGVTLVTVQWALWGREAQGAGYGLHALSSGTVDGEAFRQVLGRYSPGTLTVLPQVTIGWFQSGEGGTDGAHFITLHIHDEHELPAGDGQMVLTRLFCVPFDQLATGSVSYAAMYQGFRELRLPTPDRGPLSVPLRASIQRADPADGSDSTADADTTNLLAQRVAALLLTTKPVCILGADQVDLDSRLRFLDAVASYLPYGLRSRLSASTWVSRNFTAHKLRLFFASAARNVADPDHLVRWGEIADTPTGDELADGYLLLLTEDVLRPARLTECREPTRFTTDEIARMLNRLTSSTGSAWRSVDRPDTVRAEGLPIHEPSITRILKSCAKRLDDSQAGPQPDQDDAWRADIDHLQRYLQEPVTGKQRRRVAELISELRLLRPDAQVSQGALTKFYTALLPLAFAVPLSYQAYCRIEDWAGVSERNRPHRTLLLAVGHVGLEADVQLLQALTVGYEQAKRVLRQKSMSRRELVRLAVVPELLARHVKITCNTILNGLLDTSDNRERQALKDELCRHGFLASTLDARFPGQHDMHLRVVSGLLRAAYDRSLIRADIQGILDMIHDRPSILLFAAILQATDPQEVSSVTELVAFSVVATAGFSDKVCREFAALLGTTYPATHADATAPPATSAAARAKGTGRRHASVWRLNA